VVPPPRGPSWSGRGITAFPICRDPIRGLGSTQTGRAKPPESTNPGGLRMRVQACRRIRDGAVASAWVATVAAGFVG
jgi:hypothetical protein